MEVKLKTLKNYLQDLKHSLREISKMKLEDIKDEHKCKYFFNIARDISWTFKVLNSVINDVLKPSHFHQAQVIKRLVVDNVKDKYYICDEISLGKGRFDLLSLEKYSDSPKVVGYEIKTSKSDLKNDEKFESYLNYCNILYFVVPVKLVENAKQKISKSSLKRHIGIYSVDDEGELKLEKRAYSNKKEFDVDKIREQIYICGYNRYVYN